MTSTPLCASCLEGPKGEHGHQSLAFYVGGPMPGHNIFKCSKCDGRWIRHYGSVDEKFAWTRYNEELRTRTGAAPARTKEKS